MVGGLQEVGQDYGSFALSEYWDHLEIPPQETVRHGRQIRRRVRDLTVGRAVIRGIRAAQWPRRCPRVTLPRQHTNRRAPFTRCCRLIRAPSFARWPWHIVPNALKYAVMSALG